MMIFSCTSLSFLGILAVGQAFILPSSLDNDVIVESMTDFPVGSIFSQIQTPSPMLIPPSSVFQQNIKIPCHSCHVAKLTDNGLKISSEEDGVNLMFNVSVSSSNTVLTVNSVPIYPVTPDMEVNPQTLMAYLTDISEKTDAAKAESSAPLALPVTSMAVDVFTPETDDENCSLRVVGVKLLSLAGSPISVPRLEIKVVESDDGQLRLLNVASVEEASSPLCHLSPMLCHITEVMSERVKTVSNGLFDYFNDMREKMDEMLYPNKPTILSEHLASLLPHAPLVNPDKLSDLPVKPEPNEISQITTPVQSSWSLFLQHMVMLVFVPFSIGVISAGLAYAMAITVGYTVNKISNRFRGYGRITLNRDEENDFDEDMVIEKLETPYNSERTSSENARV